MRKYIQDLYDSENRTKVNVIEAEEEVNEDKTTILKCEVAKVTKTMMR